MVYMPQKALFAASRCWERAKLASKDLCASIEPFVAKRAGETLPSTIPLFAAASIKRMPQKALLAASRCWERENSPFKEPRASVEPAVADGEAASLGVAFSMECMPQKALLAASRCWERENWPVKDLRASFEPLVAEREGETLSESQSLTALSMEVIPQKALLTASRPCERRNSALNDSSIIKEDRRAESGGGPRAGPTIAVRAVASTAIIVSQQGPQCGFSSSFLSAH